MTRGRAAPPPKPVALHRLRGKGGGLLLGLSLVARCQRLGMM